MVSPKCRRSFFRNLNQESRGRQMTCESPPSRRKFENDWDAIDYYYYKALHWFYGRGDRRRALRFCAPLEKYLRKTASQHEAVFAKEAWSLLHEIRGDLSKAIAFRESEIKLI